jgi:uncharacterized membrane protein
VSLRLPGDRALLWVAIVAYAAGLSALSILRHRAFATGRFDLGNMVQAVWSTAHGHPLQITGLRGDQISRLGAHFDPVLAAFAPLWLVWPSPDALLVAQAIAVALGALPVYWLARKHLGSERAGLGFALAYLIYPPTQWLTLNEFHPVAFACPLLLFAIWYLDEGRLLPFAACALVAATTKEEIALVVAGLGIWYALVHRHRHRLAGAAVAVAGVAVALIAIEVVIPHFNRAGTSSFFTRYSEVGSTPGGIVHTALTDPARIVTTAFTGRGLGYLAQLALPLGLLVVLAPLVLIAAIPELAVNLLSAATTQTSIHFHYTAGLIPVLLAAAVFGAKRVPPRVPVATLVVVIAIAANYLLGPMPLWRYFPGGEQLQAHAAEVSEHDRIAGRALRLIPPHAVVSATNSLGAHLSARRRVLSFPYLQDARWVAADETAPGYADRLAPLPTAVQLSWLRRNPEWRLVFERDGILIFHRARDAASTR